MEERLKKYRVKLEQQVQENTAELVAANEEIQNFIKCDQAKEILQSSDGLDEEEGITIGDYYKKLAKMFNDESRNIAKTCSMPTKSRHYDAPDNDPFDLENWLKETDAKLG